MSDDLKTITFLDKVRTHVAYLILEAAKDPVDAAKTLLLCISPLLILAALFSWKLQRAITKQEKVRTKKEKILKKLHKGMKESEEEKTVKHRATTSQANKGSSYRDVLSEDERRKLAEMVCDEHLKSE